MPHLSAEAKHHILLDYSPRERGRGFKALAARHNIKGGATLISKWHRRWDGTPQSLEEEARSGRPRALSSAQVRRHVAAPIRHANRAARAVSYSTLLPQVQAATHTDISLRTLQRYGEEVLQATTKHGKKRTSEELSAEMCEQIAKIRRKVQRIGKDKVLFLDETYKRVGDAATDTIVLSGEPTFIASDETTKYAPRFDMIACCSGREVLPPIIYAPKERGRGINSAMLHEYIRQLLAQSAGALDRYPLILVLDRASIHSEEKMLQEFHDWGCQELKDIIKMPSAAAKRLSPLDNSLFNLWRQRVLAGGPLTKSNIKQRMSDAWNSITAANLQSQYRNCGLIYGQDVYFDCPNPADHRHSR